MIGRNVNARKTDLSSPYFDGLGKKFNERLKKPDGDKVLKEIKSINPILPLHVHHIFGYSDLLIKGFGDKLKTYIISLRNPCELVDFYINWINRLCKDSRSFKFCVKNKNGDKFPYYINGNFQKKYKDCNNIEKSILTIYLFHQKMFKMFKNLDNSLKNKIIFIPFENFTSNPDKFIDEICRKLNTDRNHNFYKMMKKENLPRKNVKNDHFTSIKFLQKYNNYKISSQFKQMLTKTEKIYNSFVKTI